MCQKYSMKWGDKGKLGETAIYRGWIYGKIEREPLLFRYSVTLTKDASGKYAVTHECLSSKKATNLLETAEKIDRLFVWEPPDLFMENKWKLFATQAIFR